MIRYLRKNAYPYIYTGTNDYRSSFESVDGEAYSTDKFPFYVQKEVSIGSDLCFPYIRSLSNPNNKKFKCYFFTQSPFNIDMGSSSCGAYCYNQKAHQGSEKSHSAGLQDFSNGETLLGTYAFAITPNYSQFKTYNYNNSSSIYPLNYTNYQACLLNYDNSLQEGSKFDISAGATIMFVGFSNTISSLSLEIMRYSTNSAYIPSNNNSLIITSTSTPILNDYPLKLFRVVTTVENVTITNPAQNHYIRPRLSITTSALTGFFSCISYWLILAQHS